ncbi:MAG: ABC transporter ATP-binding protein [Betaproteobacteria bacterium]
MSRSDGVDHVIPLAMLSVRSLTKSYAGASDRHVLRNLDLTLETGEYVAIMGESGIGKSTLLNLIAGLDSAETGSIVIDGTDIGALDDHQRTLFRRRAIGFVFQAFHLLPRLTVAQNVALPLSLLGVPRAEAAERASAMLERLRLADRASDLPRSLSSGQMQRVAIGRALIHRPRLVLADEPTGNLDPENAELVLDLFRHELEATGASAILVTHSHTAAASAQHVLVLSASGLHPGGA